MTAEPDVRLHILIDLVPLDCCRGIFYYNDSMFKVFVDFVEEDVRMGLIGYPDSGPPVERDQRILVDFRVVINPLNDDSIQLVPNDGVVQPNYCLAYHLFVAVQSDPVLLALLNPVLANHRKRTVHFDPHLVINEVVSRNLAHCRKPNLDSQPAPRDYRPFDGGVVLLAHNVDSDIGLLDICMNDPTIVVTGAPQKNSAPRVLTKSAAIKLHYSLFADHSDGFMLRISPHLAPDHYYLGILVDEHCRNDCITGFHNKR